MAKKDNSVSIDEEVQSEHYSKKSKKLKKIIIGVIILVIAIVVGLLIWLYTGQINSTKQKFFSHIKW